MNVIMMRAILQLYCLSVLLIFAACSDKPADKPATGTLNSVSTDSATSKKTNTRTILFFGNSLTAGMGLDPETAFPALIQQKVDSLAMDYLVINSGLSGETTASGKNRLSWVLNQQIDVFVLELGANDGLRGISLDETRKNLQLIIDQVKEHNPEVVIVLAGMQIPPNMGMEYTKEFQRIFPDLATKNKIALIPFLLKDVAGIPELNQQDGIHPTEEGQKIVAENVWEVLKNTL
jgi:acyl-CoA thioesterase-1